MLQTASGARKNATAARAPVKTGTRVETNAGEECGLGAAAGCAGAVQHLQRDTTTRAHRVAMGAGDARSEHCRRNKGAWRGANLRAEKRGGGRNKRRFGCLGESRGTRWEGA